jgi:hypothetical protein
MGVTSLRVGFRTGFASLGAFSFAIAVACGDEGSSTDLGVSDAAPPPLSQDGRASDATADVPTTTMRFAHLAAGIGPVDFCYRAARAGTFVGPVLGGGTPAVRDASSDAEAGRDGGEDAAADTGGAADAGRPRSAEARYRMVSSYLELTAVGSIALTVVEAGASSCANAIVTSTVTLDPGKLSTVILFGRPEDGGVGLDLGALTDDRTTLADRVRVRVVHAALGTGEVPSPGALGVRAVAGKTTVFAERVEPRKASTESPAVPVDGLGYVTAAPLPAPASIAIGPATTDGGVDAGFEPWQSAAADLGLHGGSLHSAFVLGGASAGTFEVLWCADLTTTGDETMCQLLR